MLETELIALVKDIQSKKCESNYIELKSAEKGTPKIYDTVSGFSNQEGGGTIVFGIDERNDYAVCGVYDAADLQLKISEQCSQMEPLVRPLCTVAQIDGKSVVSAEIQEIDISQKPCFYKGVGRIKGSYVRTGDSDRQMTEYEVYSFEAFRKKTQDELRIADRATLADLDTDSFNEYYLKLKKAKPMQANLPLDKIHRLQGITVDDKPTLAGVMMFSDYPQAFFPQLCMTAVVVQGYEIGDTGIDGARFIDNGKFEGTIPQMLEQALTFISRNMSVKTIIDETGHRNDKPEYPITAVREILLNALIHRDYSIHTDSSPIVVRIFKDRIEVENPGGLYGRMTLDSLGKVSADTRNPFIANIMEVLGLTENRFSGIPTIRKAMSAHGLKEPLFENDRGVFRVTLYNSTEVPKPAFENPLQCEIYEYCKDWRTRDELRTHFSHITSTYLMSGFILPMINIGLLEMALPNTPRSRAQKYRAKQ